MAVTFDCSKFHVIEWNMTCAPTTFTGGRGVDGFKQITKMNNGYWRGSVTIAPLYHWDMIDFRAFITSLQGASNPFDLCVCDPFALKGEGLTHEEWLALLGLDISTLCGPIGGKYGLPHADGTCHADGTGFAIPDFELATATNDTAAGATTITTGAGFLRAGMRFSTAENYLHEIACVTGSELEFYPPLRNALAAGASLETQNSKIKVRLANDESGTPNIRYARWTDPITLQLEEVLMIVLSLTIQKLQKKKHFIKVFVLQH